MEIEGAGNTVEVQPVSFAPEVLARVSPELSLQRHLSLGFRPSLRGFEEFRDVQIDNDTLSRYSKEHKENNVIGSNVLRSGETFVITTITGGIIEDSTAVSAETDLGEKELLEMSKDNSDLSHYTSVYPVVEVERGRTGACTDEEMTLSQKLYDSVLYSKLIPKSSLIVNPGVRITTNEENKSETRILYPDEDSDNMINDIKPNRKWSYLLYAKIVVFSRTGPVFDLCWNSLIYALQSTRLPRAFIDERATDLKMIIRTRGRSATIRETYDILCDPTKDFPLTIKKQNIGYASNYGIINLDPEAKLIDEGEEANENDIEEDIDMGVKESVLLADIDTEAEETSINSTISIIADAKGNMKQLTVFGGDAKITPSMLKKSLALSQQRATDLSSKTI